MAITKPPKLIKFADKLKKSIIKKVIKAARGKERETTNAARTLPKNNASSTITNTTASNSALEMVPIAVLIKFARS